ncbi:uncharacterized protein LOC124999245 [Mugil cephalus]|uniref:uncharacterized protein LOC124999245 n=1 Tax=Mugil cephalus TaxID=48193 RepID=UPI001FB7BF30|nr:uncharacterized protein LOC124999245 [Mugil cephalus]
MEQPTQDQSECPSALQMPDTLPIDLPPANIMDICITINDGFFLLIKQGLMLNDTLDTCDMITTPVFSCLDIIQTLAEGIVDVVIPQVYRYTRSYGTFSPSILGLNEERIHTYLGDTIELTLTRFLNVDVRNFVSIRKFSELLVRNITKAVNSVLALTTQTPIWGSRVPVFFVSGCETSVRDLIDLAWLMVLILTEARDSRRAQKTQRRTRETEDRTQEAEDRTQETEDRTQETEDRTQETEDRTQVAEDRTQETAASPLHWNPLESTGLKPPLFLNQSRNTLRSMLKNHILSIVNAFRSEARMPWVEMNTSNHRKICIRVGTNTQALTVEDSESYKGPSCSASHILPGAVPESSSACLPSATVTNRGVNYDFDPRMDVRIISEVVDDLVESFWKDPLEVEQIESYQNAAHDGQDSFDLVKLRQLTDEIFNVIMNGQVYQIPLVPPTVRMCDTVTYEKRMSVDVPNTSLATQSLYMRTEEVATRCALQVLLWSAVNREWHESSPSELSFGSELDSFMARHAAGDRASTSTYGRASASASDLASDIGSDFSGTISLDSFSRFGSLQSPDPVLTGQSEALEELVCTLLVEELLKNIGERNFGMLEIVADLRNLDLSMYNHFHAYLMGHSYKSIIQSAMAELLEEYGSVEEMQRAMRMWDSTFRYNVVKILKEQLTNLTPPVCRGHATVGRKRTCGLFKKFKKLCCMKTFRRASNVTPLISLMDDHGDSQSISCFRRMFSSFARAIRKPFTACFSPQSE